MPVARGVRPARSELVLVRHVARGGLNMPASCFVAATPDVKKEAKADLLCNRPLHEPHLL